MNLTKINLLKLSLAILCALIVADQLIFFASGRILKSQAPLLKDFIFSKLDHAPPADGYIVGSCRSAVGINPAILKTKADIQIFNASRVATGIGTNLLSLYLILSQRTPAYMIIVLDDGTWITEYEDEKKGIEQHLFWFPLLTPKYRETLKDLFHISSWKMRSGFYINKGKGWELLKNFKRHLEGRKDSYRPYSTKDTLTQWLTANPNATPEYDKIAATPFSKTIVSLMIEACLEANVQPILLTTPMHRLRNTQKAIDSQKLWVTEIAKKYQIPALFYLSRKGGFAESATYWHDFGHLNESGATAFSQLFSRDLRLLINQMEAK